MNRKITAEISFFPLNEGYGNHVIDFIHQLKEIEGLTCKVFGLSTTVIGDLNLVMQGITQIYNGFLDNELKYTLHIKIINDIVDI